MSAGTTACTPFEHADWNDAPDKEIITWTSRWVFNISSYQFWHMSHLYNDDVKYSRLSIYRGLSITLCWTHYERKKTKTLFLLWHKKDTQCLTLSGELWGIFSESSGENVPWDNDMRCEMHVIFNFSEAKLRLPMDATDNGILLGDIDGTLQGGASIIPGKIGSALYINRDTQHVDYGFHLDECYHIPDQCSNGITFALWLKARGSNTEILDTGGLHFNSFGYSIEITSSRSVRISVNDASLYHRYEAPDFPLNEWVHITVTWRSSGGLIHLYINGYDSDVANEKGYAYNLDSFTTIPLNQPFVLGIRQTVSFAPYGQADIDEPIIWERVLIPLEVWQVYVAGGVIWIRFYGRDNKFNKYYVL